MTFLPRSSCPAGDDGPDLDVVAVVQPGVAGDQAVAADDEHRLSVEPQPLHEIAYPQRARYVEVALGIVEVHLHLPSFAPSADIGPTDAGCGWWCSTRSSSRRNRLGRRPATSGDRA